MASTLEPWTAREVAGIGTDRVQWIQTSLNRVLGLRLPVDGVIDAHTRSAIRSFQTRAGLTPDGKVGPLTIAALQRAGAPAPPAAPSAPRRPAPAGNTPRCPPPSQLTPAQRTVLAVTTNFETGVPFGCAVSKVDGISMGMLQWNLKAGTLQALFRQYESAGGRLETHLGAEAPQVRALIALPPAQGVTLANHPGPGQPVARRPPRPVRRPGLLRSAGQGHRRQVADGGDRRPRAWPQDRAGPVHDVRRPGRRRVWCAPKEDRPVPRSDREAGERVRARSPRRDCPRGRGTGGRPLA